MPVGAPGFYDAVYRLVRAIPPGRVMTYGQVAAVLGAPRAARAVGYALRACRGDAVPWQRVINGRGGISIGGDAARPERQRALLEDEGIEFGPGDRIDLDRYRWDPPDPDAYLFQVTGAAERLIDGMR